MICQMCGKEALRRRGAKFCDDKCRSHYNYLISILKQFYSYAQKNPKKYSLIEYEKAWNKWRGVGFKSVDITKMLTETDYYLPDMRHIFSE